MPSMTESIGLFLIELPPEIVEEAVDRPQVALDRALAQAHGQRDFALGLALDAVRAEYGERAARKLCELYLDQCQLLPCRQLALLARIVCRRTGKPVGKARPFMVAPKCLRFRPAAVDHEVCGGAEQVTAWVSNRPRGSRRDFQPQFLEQILGGTAGPMSAQVSQQRLTVLFEDKLEALMLHIANRGASITAAAPNAIAAGYLSRLPRNCGETGWRKFGGC
jgi:hypothetical protein